MRRIVIATVITAAFAAAGRAAEIEVGKVPAVERERLGLADTYTQYARAAEGIPVIATARVRPEAVAEAVWLIDRMLARRPDVARAIARSPVRFVVMAHDEFTTDVPEHADLTPRAYWDRRARGLGATLARPATSCGEENLLCFPGDPYATENILIHEFGHTIHEFGLAQADPAFQGRLEAAFAAAGKNGRWQGTYARTNVAEYWAEGVQSWLSCNRTNDDQHGGVNSAAAVREHDPPLAALLEEVFGAEPWCYVRPRERDAADRGHVDGFDRAAAPTFDWNNLPDRAAATPAGGTTAAVLELANIFGDHMVLQRGTAVPVWGRGEPGETVTVEFAGQRKTATAAADGAWKAALDPLEAAAEPRQLVARGSLSARPATLGDVLVGDVWLCGGQSNMAQGAGPDAATEDTPLIRFAAVESYTPAQPAADIKARCRWRPADAQHAGSCSGSALWFARRVQKDEKVPIGLAISCTGGSAIEQWMSQGALERSPGAKRHLDQVAMLARQFESEPPPADREPPHGGWPGSPRWVDGHRAGRFNGMIAPLAPLAIRGALWYQGEQNAARSGDYATMLPALIADWRATFGREFPFLIVQLPAYAADKQPAGTQWAAMREVQERVARTVPRCGVAITCDNADPDQLHPRNKRTVGERLGRVALRQVYGRDVVASGPVFERMEVMDGRARIHFTETAGGLVSRTGDALGGFQVAGADGTFVAAGARIDGDTVLVSAAGVAAPQAVRYAWANVPLMSLYGATGLPAAPFRTDR